MGVRRVRKLYDVVAGQLAQMEGHLTLPDAALEVPLEAVSRWSVAQHLEHLSIAGSLTFRQIAKLLDDPDARTAGRVTVPGYAILFLGRIPRGVGKAPDRSRPGRGNRQVATEALNEARRALEGLAARIEQMAGSRVRFAHPYFGAFDCPQWLRFTAVHQNHHLRIVDEVVRAHGRVTE